MFWTTKKEQTGDRFDAAMRKHGSALEVLRRENFDEIMSEWSSGRALRLISMAVKELADKDNAA